jgi:hypothetical protein
LLRDLLHCGVSRFKNASDGIQPDGHPFDRLETAPSFC